MRDITINWFAIISISYAIWAGVTGRISWWVIILVALASVEFKSTFTRKGGK